MDLGQFIELLATRGVNGNLIMSKAIESEMVAIEELIIRKGLATKEEWAEELSKQLNLKAQELIKLSSNPNLPFEIAPNDGR